MPPEQVLDFRSVKPAADQYAAAATLYNLVTALHIYDRCDSIQKFFKLILTADPVPIQSRLPNIDPQLAAVVHRALARRPNDRFCDVLAFREALAPFASH
jgi:serine/threonine-protein kinase